MKRLLTFLLAPLLLATVACGGTGMLGGIDPLSNEAGLAELTTVDENAYLYASAAVRGISAGLVVAADTGVLRGERAGQARVLLGHLDRVWQLADTAYLTGDKTAFAARGACARQFIVQLQAIISGRAGEVGSAPIDPTCTETG